MSPSVDLSTINSHFFGYIFVYIHPTFIDFDLKSVVYRPIIREISSFSTKLSTNDRVVIFIKNDVIMKDFSKNGSQFLQPRQDSPHCSYPTPWGTS